LPHRLVRQVITYLQIGAKRTPDPPGVRLLPGDLQDASDRDPPVQICFSFDTTGSMSPYINHVRDQISALVERLLKNIPGIQVSITAHGDYGDESNYVVKTKDFSNDVTKLKSFIQSECGPTGGGDAPECYELVMHKMKELTWAATSAKALVMIGDAPPHGKAKYDILKRPFIDWKKEAAWYADNDIHVYGIKCGSSKETFYDQIAKITGALVIPINEIDMMPELFTELCFREQQRWALAVHPPPRWDVRAIADPKAALLNACGSCLLAEPNFHEPVSTSKTRIRLICRRLAREGQGEFVLKMALYCRTQLYLRSVSNYLAAIAAETKGSKEHIDTYFGHLLKLPTDMQEVAKMSISQRVARSSTTGECGAEIAFKLPRALRTAFAKKFADFSEYQLAKHKKKERLGRDGRWSSAAQRGGAREAEQGGKAAGRAGAARRRVRAEEGDVAEEGRSGADQKECGVVLSMKGLVRLCHICAPNELVMKVLGKKYPMTEEEFGESGLPGEFDVAQAGTRLRLAEPLTFQTKLAKSGNTKQAWEELIDGKGLPFMAMLRNLRNILAAGISEDRHQILLGRLQDPRQVAQSMQMPHRFLTAFLAVDAAMSGTSFGKGGGKGKGKGKGKRGGGALDPGPAPILLPAALGERYKAALEKAVKLACQERVPGGLPGHTLVLCDVSGSMRYNDFAQSARGIGGVTNGADLAILLGLLLFHLSEGPEHCQVVLFSDGDKSLKPLRLDRGAGIFGQFMSAKELVNGMAKTTELPLSWMEQFLTEFPADRIVLFSDMLIGESRNHPGGGGSLQELLARHRKHSKPECTLVCVDLFGSGATPGLDHTGDSGKGDVLLSGFSDGILPYIANPSIAGQVADVERILETLQAEASKAGPKGRHMSDEVQADEVEGEGEDAREDVGKRTEAA